MHNIQDDLYIFHKTLCGDNGDIMKNSHLYHINVHMDTFLRGPAVNKILNIEFYSITIWS